MSMDSDFNVRMISSGERPALHSYFDLCPESPDGRRAVFVELPDDGFETFRAVTVDLGSGKRCAFAETLGGNHHGGLRQQWVGNDEIGWCQQGEEGAAVTVVGSVPSRATRSIDGAIRMYCPANGMSLGSTHEERITGSDIDRWEVYLMDLNHGTRKTVVTVDAVMQIHPLVDRIDPEIMCFKHTKWAPDGKHFFCVFHNADTTQFRSGAIDKSRRLKSIMIADAEGNGLRHLCEFGHHPMWSNDSNAVVTGERRDGHGCFVAHPLDGGPEQIIVQNIPGIHSSFSPDAQWLTTDVFHEPERGRGQVRVYNVAAGKGTVVAEFDMPELPHEKRCHPHPAWSRDGKRVFFNSADTGRHQVYVVDVSPLVE